MLILKSILFGILQGLTEFIPVSSSGHLVIARSLLCMEHPGISSEIFVHTATLVVILFAFRDRIASIAASVFRSGSRNRRRDLRLVSMLAAGSIPVAVVGLTWSAEVEGMFSSLRVVGGSLLITGTALFLTRFAREGRGGIRLWDALIIGMAQAAAVIPGISRSGATISVALILGLKREESAEFCFLLAVPAIAGATVFEIAHILSGSHQVSLVVCTVSFAAALLSGIVAIKVVLKTLRIRRFGDFSYYCWVVGLIVTYVMW